MTRIVLTLALAALITGSASAHHMGIGEGDWGGFGLDGFGLGGFGGGRHGGFWGGDEFGFGRGGFGFGYGGFDTERLQTHFETKFQDLMTNYDTGLADIEDFYNSTEYTDVVDGVQKLVDRYGLFLTGVEHSVTRLGDVIQTVTDDLSFYTDLQAQYEARDDLSQDKLDRILMRLTGIEDHLTSKIDLLTGKQTTLSDNLGTYQSFSDDLSAYLDKIVSAAGTTGSTDTPTAVVAATSVLTDNSVLDVASALAATADEVAPTPYVSIVEPPQLAVAAATVAEPSAGLLAATAASVLALWSSSRRRAKM